jgi:hypothetical protein
MAEPCLNVLSESPKSSHDSFSKLRSDRIHFAGQQSELMPNTPRQAFASELNLDANSLLLASILQTSVTTEPPCIKFRSRESDWSANIVSRHPWSEKKRVCRHFAQMTKLFDTTTARIISPRQSRMLEAHTTTNSCQEMQTRDEDEMISIHIFHSWVELAVFVSRSLEIVSRSGPLLVCFLHMKQPYLE